MDMVKINKKGWTRIIEAFVSILLITIVLLLILSESDIGNKNLSEQIYEQERAILKEIELNNVFRQNILAVASLPLSWDDFDSNGLTEVKNKINEKVASYLTCVAYVCSLEDICAIGEEVSSEIYVQKISINADLDDYSPRKLKLFCWLD